MNNKHCLNKFLLIEVLIFNSLAYMIGSNWLVYVLSIAVRQSFIGAFLSTSLIISYEIPFHRCFYLSIPGLFLYLLCMSSSNMETNSYLPSLLLLYWSVIMGLIGYDNLNILIFYDMFEYLMDLKVFFFDRLKICSLWRINFDYIGLKIMGIKKIFEANLW